MTNKKLLTGLLVFFIAVFLLGAYLPKSFIKSAEISYVLQKGRGYKKIAEDLKEKGVIRSQSFFEFYVLVSLSYSKLQAGRYELSSSMAVAQIVKKLVTGDVVKEKITIIEGWNIKSIAKELENKGLYQTADFLNSAQRDFSQGFEFLKDKPKDLSLEGYIFPDTYYIIKETTAEEFLKMALLNFDKKLISDLKKEIAKQSKSIFQIATMASMLEKEVKSLDDKKIVSGILWKRIKEGIPLQVDSTVNYITGKNDAKISLNDAKIDSKYNTYKYYGLPMGPISNPGMDSILSAIYPEESPYWYYLSADGNGKTIFSKTLAEHNTAKTKYFKP